LLESGKRFDFAAPQKRLLPEDDEFFTYLVFFIRLLRCFSIIAINLIILKVIRAV
jgi:predicted nuclease of restriction endonuclease-like (RecB) superfamily